MATNTTILGLRKPVDADDVDVALDISANMDIIDGLGLGQTTIIRQAAETENTSDTTWASTDLQLTAVAGQSYKFRFNMLYEGHIDVDIEFRLRHPGGELDYNCLTQEIGMASDGNSYLIKNLAFMNDPDPGTVVNAGTSGFNQARGAYFEGTFVATGNGALKIEYKKRTSSTGAIQIEKGSTLEYVRFA